MKNFEEKIKHWVLELYNMTEKELKCEALKT